MHALHENLAQIPLELSSIDVMHMMKNAKALPSEQYDAY
jgi:hypothetical protein